MPDVPAGTGQCQAVPDSALPWLVLPAARCAPRTEVTPPLGAAQETRLPSPTARSLLSSKSSSPKKAKKSNVGTFSVPPPGRTDLAALPWAGDTWELQFSLHRWASSFTSRPSFSSWPWYPAALPGVSCEAALTPPAAQGTHSTSKAPQVWLPGDLGLGQSPFGPPPQCPFSSKDV